MDWIDQDLEMGATEYRALVDEALTLKRMKPHEKASLLRGKTIYFIFFNQSLRTRSSFLTGLSNLGGLGIVLDPNTAIYTPAMPDAEVPYSTERIADIARVLSQYGDAIAIRMYGAPAQWIYGRANATMREFANWASIPIINMECDRFHPCQALADMMTLREHFSTLRGRRLVVSWAYSGSWHKPVAVPQSAILAGAKMGMHVVLVHPVGFELDPQVLAATDQFAADAGGSFSTTSDMHSAFRGADVVYPKSWCSLKYLPIQLNGEVDEPRMKELFEQNRDWICDSNAMTLTAQSGIYMHCLPCDRGQEVEDDVIDGPRSVVFRQAENRLHAQNAVMLRLLAERD